MGLFYRREQPQTEVPYTISVGKEQTKLIVGLGNKGKKYDGTRHNIGFVCLDEFASAENGSFKARRDIKSLICELRIGQSRVILVKPTTFMNHSGEAVQAVQRFYKITNDQTIVVHDELDIPFGQIRTRLGGSAAGHNGVKSLIEHIGTDFGRIRIGIKNDHSSSIDSADFVLQKFSKQEQANIKTVINEANSILNEAVFGDKLTEETRSAI